MILRTSLCYHRRVIICKTSFVSVLSRGQRTLFYSHRAVNFFYCRPSASADEEIVLLLALKGVKNLATLRPPSLGPCVWFLKISMYMLSTLLVWLGNNGRQQAWRLNWCEFQPLVIFIHFYSLDQVNVFLLEVTFHVKLPKTSLTNFQCLHLCGLLSYFFFSFPAQIFTSILRVSHMLMQRNQK